MHEPEKARPLSFKPDLCETSVQMGRLTRSLLPECHIRGNFSECKPVGQCLQHKGPFPCLGLGPSDTLLEASLASQGLAGVGCAMAGGWRLGWPVKALAS